jgi:hypothetical protein
MLKKKWEQRSLENRNKIWKILYFFLWWLKGKTSALVCLGYGVKHATLEGSSMKDLVTNYHKLEEVKEFYSEIHFQTNPRVALPKRFQLSIHSKDI